MTFGKFPASTPSREGVRLVPAVANPRHQGAALIPHSAAPFAKVFSRRVDNPATRRRLAELADVQPSTLEAFLSGEPIMPRAVARIVAAAKALRIWQ